MSYPQVADLSSAQMNPDGSGFDAAAYKASGRTAVIIKATEGMKYFFKQGAVWTSQALAEGLTVGRYHFAGDSQHGVLGTPAQEASWFWTCVGNHQPGVFAVVDFENPLHGPALYGLSPQAAAEWCGEFLDFLASHGNWPGMAYSMSGSGVIQLLKSPYKRWYAGYPNLVNVKGPVDLHQFTDHGSVPGVGNCDDSYCYIDLAAFAQGSYTPPEEEDMQRLFTHKGGEYIGDLFANWCRPIPDQRTWDYYKNLGVQLLNVNGSFELDDFAFNQLTKRPVAE